MKKTPFKNSKRVQSELQHFETEILYQQFPSSQNVPSFHTVGQVFSILFLNRGKSDTVSEDRTMFSSSLLHFLSPLKKKAVILDVLICPVLKWWDETFNVQLAGPKNPVENLFSWKVRHPAGAFKHELGPREALSCLCSRAFLFLCSISSISTTINVIISCYHMRPMTYAAVWGKLLWNYFWNCLWATHLKCF